MLAIIGAMPEEVELPRRQLTALQSEKIAGMPVARGEFHGADAVVAQSGVGKVNAAICTQMLIDRFRPDAVVFAGAAGALLSNARVGDIVIASSLIQHDVDLTAFGRRFGEVPDRGRSIEADPFLVQSAAAAFDKAFADVAPDPQLTIGNVVSGDRFIQDSKTLQWLQREFAAVATEMEGAAVGYACSINGVPFVVIRAISDFAGQLASADFSDNLVLAAKNLFRLLNVLVPALASHSAPAR